MDKISPPARNRFCLVTRKRFPRNELIRFVRSPEGNMIPDLAEKLPGRGFWLKADPQTILGVGKIFKRKSPDTEELANRLEMLLLERVVSLLALCRRAGLAVAGFEKTASLLKSGRAGLRLEARDRPDNGGRKKLDPLAKNVMLYSPMTSDELGQAFGRDMVVHLAVKKSPLCDKLKEDIERLTKFRKPFQKKADQK